jgi:hypothetical protein
MVVVAAPSLPQELHQRGRTAGLEAADPEDPGKANAWASYVDPATGRKYVVNERTGVSKWSEDE